MPGKRLPEPSEPLTASALSRKHMFQVLPLNQLSEKNFDEYPVWSEHYDWDEIRDIERWGLDQEYVLRLFEENSPDNEHCVYTLLESNPFPDRMRIFIRAAIRAADGRELKGYIMNEDAFCLGIYHHGEEFVFSKHPMLEPENKKDEQQLLRALGGPATIFPVKYETEFRQKTGGLITGEFKYGARDVTIPSAPYVPSKRQA
jgi:hypothetical protein